MNRCQPVDVNARLDILGVDSNQVSGCVKVAMAKGLISLTGRKSDLDQLIIEGEYDDHKYEVYLKNLLYQPDYGGNEYEEGARDSPVICTCCQDDTEEYDYKHHCYVTRICQGNPTFDSGKFHNHCTDCSGFGQCIGDCRNAHCPKCGCHWFTGFSGMRCTNCGGDSDDTDYSDDDFW